jgi:aldehyde dehydrogenase (NAD+)
VGHADSITVTISPEVEPVVTQTGSLDAARLVGELRATYDAGHTRSYAWRDSQLDALVRMLTEREDELVAALAADLGRPELEAWVADVRIIVREIEEIRKHYRGWAGERRYKTPLFFRPGRSDVRFDPLGVVLVIAPWNYPVQLLISPLAAVIAAGNAAVAKPSELAPATSAVLTRLAGEYLDQDAIRFVEGGIEESTALLEQRWDHIMYTGNGMVGRIVAAAAARHLTPVTLELGGQSPAIVDNDVNLTLAVDRIAGGKWINAGQTCIAPNHVFVHEDVEEEFLERLRKTLKDRYGKDPKASKDFGRIVNERHAARIAGLIAAGGYDEVAAGGDSDVTGRYVAPTVLRGVKPDAAVMQEEIFGPVLPVIPFADLDEPIAAINAGEKPLALYVFSRSEETVERVLDETSSGGVSVNDVFLHMMSGEMPFGGVGESGYGAYHGRTGFERFSHAKAVYRRPSWFKDPALLKPPYKAWKLKVLRKIY